MNRIVCSTLLCLSFVSGLFAQQSSDVIAGTVRNKDNEALSFAAIFVKELNLGIVANNDGYFKFPVSEGDTYTLRVSYLNHVETEIQATGGTDTQLDIVLEKQSYALKEVVVMADYQRDRGTTAVINQQALEHIQPTSVSDVMILTPGGLLKDTQITKFNRISVRQSGEDDNTSLGMAVVMDGIPQDNDGFRSQIPDMDSNDSYAERFALNKGIDLKTLSTDHIQKIEIVKGISSAKLGNLSSGVIRTTSKIGQTPLQLRVKTDPLTKLIYLGKGQKLSQSLGYIHAGVDYVSVYDDKRDPLSKYNRITGQITYNNSLEVAGRSLFLFLKLSEVYTLNKAKEDELVAEYNESFTNTYSRSGLSMKARLADVNRLIDNIELISSVDYTYDLIDRNRMVQLGAPLPTPLALEEGESEGLFLPSQYYSPFKIENKPFALLTQLNMESLLERGTLKHKFVYGLEWKNTKNYGRGVMIDMSRPPYPGDSKYVRPTPNNAIPALSVGAAYLEDQLTHSNPYFDLNLYAGLRASKMFNLSSDYTQLNKIQLEPRLNLSVAHDIKLSGNKLLKNLFRVGFGQESKFPTLDFLYPDKVYKDLIVLSAYVKHEDPNNHLITNTRIYDVVNHNLKANKNNKFEAGWDMEFEDYLLSLTFFREFSKIGYQKTTAYNPVSYLRYIEPANGTQIIGKQPQKSDYIEEQYATFLDIPVISNSAELNKKGLEYRLKLPRLSSLFTTIEVNGAYYETSYTTSTPVHYHPSFKDENKPLPYVGIYDTEDVTRRRIFNSNVWFNTNIPKYKIVFTTLFQFIWLNDVKRINGDAYPSAYMDINGSFNNVSEAISNKIKEGDLIWRHYHLYKEPYHEKEPVSLAVNFKVTKEFNKLVRASFFVNNILNINPEYKNRYEQNVRNWKKAFFGVEMTLSVL